MEIEIVSRKENKVLEREEIIFKIKYEGKTRLTSIDWLKMPKR